MNDVVLYATDTMADWEYGYLAAGLAMGEHYGLRVVSETGDPVRTMGGMRIAPDGRLDDVRVDALAALVLPGADTWASGHDAVLGLARRALDAGVPVAGICGATFGLARAGLLDDRAHTSNAPEFLAPSGYRGAERYRSGKAVTDRHLITAPATAPIDFARALFEDLDALPAPVVEAWYGLHTTGERRYFEQLVGA